MNILISVFHFPPMSGGGAVLSSEIANSFSEQGHQVYVVIPKINWKEAIFEPELDSKIKIIRVKTPSENNIKIAARLCKNNIQKEIEKICSKEDIEFIFTIFHPFHKVPHAAIQVGNKLKIPVIVKVDDPIYAKSKGIKSLQRTLEKRSNKKALQNADKILVVNNTVKKTIIEEYKIKEQKISIIPNGIDTKIFRDKVENIQKFTIVFSGMMYYHRGIDVLLDSISRIISKFPNIQVILLGDGPEMTKLKEISEKMNLTKNVQFKGWVDRKEILNYLANSSVGIGPLKLTEITESALPIKVLEYMAASLPIIAKFGTLPEDVLNNGKNGYFVKNSEDLAEKLECLVKNNNLLINMGKESRKMVKKFDWKNITSMILDQYKNLEKNFS